MGSEDFGPSFQPERILPEHSTPLKLGTTSELRFHPDLDNTAHGTHHDVVQRLPDLPEQKGAEQMRISPEGDLIGGTTNIGPIKLNWP
jgi:hypothetical protein